MKHEYNTEYIIIWFIMNKKVCFQHLNQNSIQNLTNSEQVLIEEINEK